MYNHSEIEQKWQKYWAEHQTFRAETSQEKQKFYVLDMFPYPSWAGLHVGHPLWYIASDIVARYKRHQWYNVLHPQWYDSFGLPAEQYAIQTGQHPAITTHTNINRYREQLDKLGFSFDWTREIRTSEPNYYQWTQWIFLQLFDSYYDNDTNQAESITRLISLFEKNGNTQIRAACDDNTPLFSAEEWNAYWSEKKQEILLKYRLTYLAETQVNWCEALGTVLANDEVINGVSERGWHPVVRKKMKQWSMRISAYAERLLQGLETIDWTESLKETQRNWIGKSVGASVRFRVLSDKETPDYIEVFTTRPDTLFWVSFMTLAPEHELVPYITTPEQQKEVQAYIDATKKRSERERTAEIKTVSWVFTGAYAQHPFTNEPIPIWIGDYVLAGYGTGAVMSVPCGDERDFAFAKYFNIPIKNIFDQDITDHAFMQKSGFKLVNSDFLTGMDYQAATKKIIEELEKIGAGKQKINYRMRDAVFSRQRYWWEPFPIYYVNGLPQAIPEKYLPIHLPEVEKYLPTPDGQAPLGNATKWAWDTQKGEIVSNTLIDHTTIFPLELNTMPGWAGSSWYWLRYMDAQNKNEFASKESMDYWQNVDLYVWGSEHATGHLLYSRFWNKFLKDKNLAPTEEPFQKLINQGMILGMSAFVYRTQDSKKLISKNQIGNTPVHPIHVDLGVINDITNELDIEQFLAHPLYQEYKNAEFVLEENGKYIVGREVEKMSKSKYNVINPDDICQEYGADTLRLYEMFLGPLEQAKPWNTAGMTGVYGFLKKLWRLYHDITLEKPTPNMYKTLHKTIQKVTEDIENFSLNTSVSQFMICVNELSEQKCHHYDILETLTILISPYAPHIAEELWEKLGKKETIAFASWPQYNPSLTIDEEVKIGVQVLGKLRWELSIHISEPKENVLERAKNIPELQKWLQNKQIVKEIYVPGKIVNFVIKE